MPNVRVPHQLKTDPDASLHLDLAPHAIQCAEWLLTFCNHAEAGVGLQHYG